MIQKGKNNVTKTKDVWKLINESYDKLFKKIDVLADMIRKTNYSILENYKKLKENEF